jgi:6-pyruvoyltetrahydropterin/6-carboxytetrahydropterin synthase
MITCTKTFADLPFAHRQHNHDGHCALVHGHNWSFTFEFGATELDADGFVIDFGKLKWLRKGLEELFDHTLLLNECDPDLEFYKMFSEGVADKPKWKLTIVPNCGAEGLAQYLLTQYQPIIATLTNGRVFIHSVTVHEDTRNSAKLTRNV